MTTASEELARINKSAIEYAALQARGWAPGRWESMNIVNKGMGRDLWVSHKAIAMAIPDSDAAAIYLRDNGYRVVQGLLDRQGMETAHVAPSSFAVKPKDFWAEDGYYRPQALLNLAREHMELAAIERAQA